VRPVLAEPFEDFATVARRLEIASRIVTAQEWTLDGADPYETACLLRDLERDVVLAAEQNELEDAA